MKLSKVRNTLYKAARALGDASAVASGDPKKVARRGKNKIVGRLLGPFWRKLWR